MWVIVHLWTTKSAVPVYFPHSIELGHQRRKSWNIVAIQKATVLIRRCVCPSGRILKKWTHTIFSPYRMVSEVLTTLCSGHHLGEGSRCQVPAADSQQGLQVGVGLLQVVEKPGKQPFQMLIMSKLDPKLIKRRRREEEKLL